MKRSKRKRRRLPLHGAKRVLAFQMLTKGVGDVEICEVLKISQEILERYKTPYIMRRVESAQLGEGMLARFKAAESDANERRKQQQPTDNTAGFAHLGELAEAEAAPKLGDMEDRIVGGNGLIRSLIRGDRPLR